MNGNVSKGHLHVNENILWGNFKSSLLQMSFVPPRKNHPPPPFNPTTCTVRNKSSQIKF